MYFSEREADVKFFFSEENPAEQYRITANGRLLASCQSGDVIHVLCRCPICITISSPDVQKTIPIPESCTIRWNNGEAVMEKNDRNSNVY